MSRIPRLALGIGACLVVAVAAILVGMRFASPEEVAAVATEEVGVLAPIAVNGEPVLGDNDPDTLEVSQTTGTASIVDPDSFDPDALPPGVAEAIAALEESGGDAADAYVALESLGDARDDDGAAGGDPCSPEEGAVPEDCPEGLHSAIFADTELEDLQLWPFPDPPRTFESSSIVCPDLDPGDGELGLGVGTNLPATITARYWPVSDPTDVRMLTLEGNPTEVARWQAEIDATGDYSRGAYMFQHCATMTGLAPATDYIVSVFGADVYGRISAPVEQRFNSAGTPTVPPMWATTYGSSLLWVVVPTVAAGDPPLVYAWVAQEGTAPDWSAADSGHRYLNELDAGGLVEVSAEYLHDHNYMAAYTREVQRAYLVPEGSTVVVCARWFDRSAPVWDRDIPTKQKSIVVMSPDAVNPILTVTTVNPIKDLARHSITLKASDQFGMPCGLLGLPDEAAAAGTPVAIDEVVCRPAEESSEFRRTSGSFGNVVLSTKVGTGASAATTRTMLPLSRYACLGVCDLPPTLTYAIPLPTVTVGTGLCGGSGCAPPTRETALGTAEIEVTWEQGNTNGLDHWSIGEVNDAAPDAPVFDVPQFDTDAYWATSLSDSGWIGSARLALRADRHVTYTVSIAGDCFVGEPPAPVTGGTFRDSAGIEASSVSFSGLCPGATYETTVELVDDAGARTVAAHTGSAATVWWYPAQFTVPINAVEITGTVTVTSDAAWAGGWWLVGTDVYLGNTESRIWDVRETDLERCFSGATHTTTWPFSHARAAQAELIHIHNYTRVMTEGLYYGVDHNRLCDWPGATDWIADVDADIPFDQLLRGVTLTGDLWQSGFAEGLPGHGRFQYSLTLTATRVTE
jgi:hypothetical protein